MLLMMMFQLQLYSILSGSSRKQGEYINRFLFHEKQGEYTNGILSHGDSLECIVQRSQTLCIPIQISYDVGKSNELDCHSWCPYD